MAYLVKDETLTDIADAIREKKGSEEPIKCEDFAEEIENISFDVEPIYPKQISFSYSSRTQIDLSMLRIDDLTTMYQMFFGCSSLTSLDVSNFNTSNVKSMYEMFSGCSSLTSINLPIFDIQKVNAIYNLFSSCSKLESIRLQTTGTGLFTDLSNMFNGCNKIKNIDIREFASSNNITNIYAMFAYCRALEHIDIRSLELTNATNYGAFLNQVPTTCEIIVKDTANKQWFATNFPTYTNVKTAEEYESGQNS